MSTISDTIKAVQELRYQLNKDAKDLPSLFPGREEVLGLQYKKGDKVKDERTGKIYTVIAGTRKSVAVSDSGS